MIITDTDYIRETEKAILVTHNDKDIWIPKSVLISKDYKDNSINIEDWFVKKVFTNNNDQ